MARISQVTWLRSLLCSTAMISRGSVHCCQYLAMVISSAMPFICIAPSPTKAMPGRSGWAHFAPITYGTPGPMVARVPDSEPRTPAGNFRWRAYQLAADPESAAMIALAGMPLDSSQKIRIGLTGSASVIAVRCTVVHQLATCFSICLAPGPVGFALPAAGSAPAAWPWRRRPR